MKSNLAIKNLRLDFQPAENLLEDQVQHYIELLRNGQEIEPITVRFDGHSYFLQDGFHRVEAARRMGMQHIHADVMPGNLQDMEAEFDRFLQELKRNLRQS
jgi:hypothetical protein